mmetsp:Transcript_30800/g.60523  ORF Transcript_30800/g.60523 Transcript_30800/m.60523 type:complete len:474 (-) Transcript_30800:108-1529(-)
MLDTGLSTKSCLNFVLRAMLAILAASREEVSDCLEGQDSCKVAATSLLAQSRVPSMRTVAETSFCDEWKAEQMSYVECDASLLINCNEDAMNRAVLQEEKLAAAFNENRIDDIPKLYTKDAILVPPNMEFVQQPKGIKGVFGALRKQLKGDAKFEPVSVEYESNVILEIGKATIGSDFTSTYYVRHVCEGKKWYIETDILSINRGCSGVDLKPRKEGDIAMQVALEAEQKLAAAYNSNNFDRIPALYSRVPAIIPPPLPFLRQESLYEKYEIGPLFRDLNSKAFPEASGDFKPIRALEVKGVIHEIGLALFDGQAKTVYYVRHAKECGSGCKLFADLFSICLLPKKCYKITDSFAELLDNTDKGDVRHLVNDEQRNRCIQFNSENSASSVPHFQRMDDHGNKGAAAAIITLIANGYSKAQLKRVSGDDQRNKLINIAHRCNGASIPHLQGMSTLDIAKIANKDKCCERPFNGD